MNAADQGAAAQHGRGDGPTQPPSTDVPSAARAYDYFLGGAHNFEADRAFAEQVRALVPWVPDVARLNRSFLRRAVRLCLDQGITQFLDLGSGIPTVGNVHEIAQQQVPDARVVYVDHEIVAYETAKSMLAGDPHTTIIQADIRDPHTILEHPETTRLLDFSQPLGLLMVGVLLFVSPADDPDGLVATYRERLAPGSCLAISHIADEHADPQLRDQVAQLVALYQQADEHVVVRTHAEISRWFDGMDLVEPGVAFLPDWRPDNTHEAENIARPLGYGGVAVMPAPSAGR